MSTRIWTYLGALSCAALFCAASCQKDRVQEPGADRDSVKSPAEASRPINRSPSTEGRGSLPLDSWSPDTEAIFSIDVAQFRKSPVGGLVDSWLRTIAPSATGCGQDIVEHVSQMLVVTNSADKGKPLYVLGGLERSQANGCTSQPSVWLDDATLVVAPDWEQAALDAATTGTDHRTNPRVLAAISHLDTSAALWVAAATPADAKDWIEEFSEMRGTVVLDGGLRATFGLKFKDADKAASAAQEFERTVKQMPPFSTYFEDVRAYADGPWLQTSLVMSRKQLKRFSTDPMFSGMFPSPPEADVVVTVDQSSPVP